MDKRAMRERVMGMSNGELARQLRAWRIAEFKAVAVARNEAADGDVGTSAVKRAGQAIINQQIIRQEIARRARTMTEEDLFAEIDAKPGETMIAFDSKAMAMRYCLWRVSNGISGMMLLAEDTRTNSGLCVLWREPVPLNSESATERQGNCAWLLEEILAGRQPWPTPGKVTELQLDGDQG